MDDWHAIAMYDDPLIGEAMSPYDHTCVDSIKLEKGHADPFDPLS
jgi:hypothetical protein